MKIHPAIQSLRRAVRLIARRSKGDMPLGNPILDWWKERDYSEPIGRDLLDLPSLDIPLSDEEVQEATEFISRILQMKGDIDKKKLKEGKIRYKLSKIILGASFCVFLVAIWSLAFFLGPPSRDEIARNVYRFCCTLLFIPALLGTISSGVVARYKASWHFRWDWNGVWWLLWLGCLSITSTAYSTSIEDFVKGPVWHAVVLILGTLVVAIISTIICSATIQTTMLRIIHEERAG